MSTGTRAITDEEHRALTIIGAAVPCFVGETIADQAKRLVDVYRATSTALANARTMLSVAKETESVMLRPAPTDHEREARAVASLGGTRGT